MGSKMAENSIQDATSVSLAQLARAKLRKSSKLGVTLSAPHSCSISRCGCVEDVIHAMPRAPLKLRSPSKERSSSKQRSASKHGAAVKVSVTLPLAALAPRACHISQQAISQVEIATPTPHALTEAALLKSRNLLAQLSDLDLDMDADSAGRGEDRNESSDIEFCRFDGDDDTSDDSIDGSEQVRLLRLASDMWSRITDETSEPPRSDSKSSLPSWSSSFESSVVNSDVVQATDDIACAAHLFSDDLRAILRSEVTCHDDAAGRTKAGLFRMGEVNSREAAGATTASALQRQPTPGQLLLPTPRLEPLSHPASHIATLSCFVCRDGWFHEFTATAASDASARTPSFYAAGRP